MAAWIPAAIGAGASIIGNLFSKKSSDDTNKTNMQIAQMNNEWSERMMQKQMDYNTDMWNKQNEYNDPTQQVERLKKAGINPALALSNISTGTAQSGNSVGLPSPSSTSVQPYKYDFSGIGSAVMSAASINNLAKVQDSQARFTNMQADYYGAKTMAEIYKLYTESESHTAKTYYQNLLNKYGDSMLSEQYLGEVRRRQSTEMQIFNSIKQGVLLDKQIARYDEETNARIGDMVASAVLKRAQGRLTDEQLNSQIQHTIGNRLDNHQKRAIFDYVVEKARIDSLPSNPFHAGYDLGKTAWEVVKSKWNDTDWKNIHKRGYPKPW